MIQLNTILDSKEIEQQINRKDAVKKEQYNSTYRHKEVVNAVLNGGNITAYNYSTVKALLRSNEACLIVVGQIKALISYNIKVKEVKTNITIGKEARVYLVEDIFNEVLNKSTWQDVYRHINKRIYAYFRDLNYLCQGGEELNENVCIQEDHFYGTHQVSQELEVVVDELLNKYSTVLIEMSKLDKKERLAALVKVIQFVKNERDYKRLSDAELEHAKLKLYELIEEKGYFE